MNRPTRNTLFGFVLFLILAGLYVCEARAADEDVYTLYRSSLVPGMRVHVSTFDVDEKGDYNRENCMTAANLFAGQTGVSVGYWCEKGRFRK